MFFGEAVHLRAKKIKTPLKGVGTDLGKTASLSRPYLHEGMVLQFLQYGGMDRESEAVFRMRIDARNGANADDLCRWLQGYSPVFRS